MESMGNKIIVGAIGVLFVLLVIPLTLDDSVFADKKITKHTTDLIHLGYLQLAAHDFFNMDRTKEKDFVTIIIFGIHYHWFSSYLHGNSTTSYQFQI